LTDGDFSTRSLYTGKAKDLKHTPSKQDFVALISATFVTSLSQSGSKTFL